MLVWAANGSVRLRASKLESDSETLLDSEVRLVGVSQAANEGIWFKVQAAGDATTALRPKA